MESSVSSTLTVKNFVLTNEEYFDFAGFINKVQATEFAVKVK